METQKKKWTISDIRRTNAETGGYFFSKDTMRFFKSRVLPYVYQGLGGIYFVTADQMVSSSGPELRKFKVRKFNPETGDVRTYAVIDREEFSFVEDARIAARLRAHNKAEGR